MSASTSSPVRVDVPADEVTAICSTRWEAGSIVMLSDPTTPESPRAPASAVGVYACGCQV